MATYSTPGVYIKEIAKFPPSVAQVETAIPAFIGYTEKATNKNKGDLNGIATPISSMLEYENYFGSALPEANIAATVVDGVVSIDIPSKSPFLMYYSLQLYFANGGGPCYIVSVGRYGAASDLADTDTPVTTVADTVALNAGLRTIEKEDEPTLLLFPDATSLADSNAFYGLYQNALLQCNKLQDRFAIIDTYGYDTTSVVDPNIEGLRNGITLGKDFKKYGAAYYPFVETILDHIYNDADVQVSATSTELISEIVSAAKTSSTTSIAQVLNAQAKIAAAADAAEAKGYKPDAIAPTKNIIKVLKSTTDTLTTVLASAAAVTGTTSTEFDAAETELTTLKANVDAAIAAVEAALTPLNSATSLAKINDGVNGVVTALDLSTATDPLTAQIVEDFDTVVVSSNMTIFIAVLGSEATVESKIDCPLIDLESFDNPLYNSIKSEIGQVPVILPPSSGMAGVYARVDNNRGVWKAPANVGLNYVIKPTVHISHEEQETLNIHTTGKSINAIRTFTGKGTLVWGARTLAGNDNEWRYVSVRRFFNMAEESIKKATEQFVFEPNDANTWVKVKAMIDNFLTLQWRAGALAGPTPDKAFYVSVGLGETMTAEDILNGYMFVEIGMAVVRPAEFIILKFSHKMQEA